MTEHVNYTPHDILGFGQRAESEGRFAYAHQIYSHLAHYYAHEQVGAAARAGLARIGNAGRQPPVATSDGLRPQTHQAVGQGRIAEPSHASPQQGYGVAPVATRAVGTSVATGTVAQQRSMPPATTHTPSNQSNHGQGDDGYDSDELADVRLSFKSGMFTMRLAQVLGWLAMVTGVIAMVLEIVGLGSSGAAGGGEVVREVAASWLTFLMPVGLVIAGIVLVLVSQIARASFEAANSARQLLVLERSRSGI
ncbi:MAG: hypothetical protein ACRBCJ_02975 [Hyphomicrobiaceae bacterium]